MVCNMLKLNATKTEFIVFSPSRSATLCQNSSMQRSFHPFQRSSCIKNLGVMLDQSLSMRDQVDMTVKFCYFHIRTIGRVRRYLSQKACETLVYALVTSRLDYCNSLLLGVSQRLFARLQRVQNTAARLVLRLRKREHITPALASLHWLPIKFRPRFKILVLTFNALRGTGPRYLRELVARYQPVRSLRSEAKNLLKVPVSRTRSYGSRTFAAAAAAGLWNELPDRLRDADDVEHFKRDLKTHFFRCAFSS